MRILCVMVVLGISVGDAKADNWPGWRGPASNGVAAGANYPIRWSNTQNVAWKAALPGRGSSTTAVWGDRIFVTSPGAGKNMLLCFDRDGKKIWQVTLGNERGGKNRKASGSNPSPTTDGQHVYVYYKSGELVCVDFAGKIVWQKNLQKMYGKDTLWWDLGSSPVLTRNLVVVVCMQEGPSYVAGFDKRTGRTVWKQDRTFDAPRETDQSYTTPVVVTEGDRETIVVLGADHVTAHAADTGEELWRVGGLNPDRREYFRSIASPIVADGLVIAPYARGGSLTAIRLGGSGDVTKSHVVWVKPGPASDVPSPAVIGGRIYVCTDRGEVACADLKTGKKLWGQRVERNRNGFSASPIVAGGNIYAIREDGKTFVLEQGDAFKLVATNELNEFTVATPVFTRGQILIRTGEHLYCIGKPSQSAGR